MNKDNNINNDLKISQENGKRKYKLIFIIVFLVLIATSFFILYNSGFFVTYKLIKIENTLEKIQTSELSIEERKSLYIDLIKNQLKGSFMDKWKGTYTMHEKGGLPRYLGLFDMWAIIVNISSEFTLTNEEQALIERFAAKISEVQIEAYPKMRVQMRNELNIKFPTADISLSGKDFNILVFHGDIPSLYDGQRYMNNVLFAYLARKIILVEYYNLRGELVWSYPTKAFTDKDLVFLDQKNNFQLVKM